MRSEVAEVGDAVVIFISRLFDQSFHPFTKIEYDSPPIVCVTVPTTLIVSIQFPLASWESNPIPSQPPEKDNPLLKNNKTILSPHTAALTEECRRRMGIEAVQNLIDFFENKLDKSKIVKL